MAAHYSGKDLLTGRRLSKKPPMPFIWNMAVYCLELPGGRIRHFPAGSYYQQVETWTGEAELGLMKIAHNAWYTFGHIKRENWKVDDLKLFDALRKVPELPPSRRLEAFINTIFPTSNWTLIILEGLKSPR